MPPVWIALNSNVRRDLKAPPRSTRHAGDFSAPADYFDAILRAGGRPFLMPATADEKAISDYLDRADGLILTGGADYPPEWYGQRLHPRTTLLDPRRAECDRLLARAALDRNLPVLGICGGQQLLAIASGGALIQHIETALQHSATDSEQDGPPMHEVAIAPDSRLAALIGAEPLRVNSTHHQCVDPARPGAGWRVCATAPDGTPEAIEPVAPGVFRFGVQWHPERLTGQPRHRRLFEALVAAAAERREAARP